LKGKLIREYNIVTNMRRYLVFFVVCLLLMLASISNSAASVAFPVIMIDLKTTLVITGWVLTVYQLVQTIVMALAGKISEVLNRRTTFMACTALFSVGSVMCALAPSIYWLIGARVVQAIGGGGFMPVAAGIVSDEFPEQRHRYIGLFSSIFPIGMIIGPNLGGWMVEAFGWRSIFWFNVPLGIVILALAWFMLRPGDKKKVQTSIDFTGAGLLFGALSSLMFSLTELGNNASGTPWLVIALFLVLGIVLFVYFLRWERRAKEPIIDMELLRKKPFLATNIYNVIYGVCALGIPTLIPLYAVNVYNMTTLQSGIVLTPRSIGTIAASTITSFMLVKWGYRRPILAGSLMIAAVLVLLGFQAHELNMGNFAVGSTPILLVILGLYGVGIGIAAPASNNACIELMPNKVSTIVGLRGMFRQLGSAVGIAISTVILHTVTDVQRAYYIVMFASAAVMLISIPAIFFLPASPLAGAAGGRETKPH
jgi:EmrB/QacA subfamily drug resistance transporter